jgi:1,2-diacylglycerol 3-alpha-glucosyltransferase
MNILMMTNTYKPILGGLEKSVEAFSREFRNRGHRVIIVAPEYPGMEPEQDVVRVPAVQNFNGSDFSVQLPIPGVLNELLGHFRPDIVHTHHPFLIGDTALRVSAKFNVPLVFTHHTLYEENVHYVPGNAEALKRFVIELSTGFANLADLVIAPSESVSQMIKQRGVTTPVEVIPTGIYPKEFSRGAGKAFRKQQGIPSVAFVIGHLGRLAPEKNLEFVTDAVSEFLVKTPGAHFLIGGKGPCEEMIDEIMTKQRVKDRLHRVGFLSGKELRNAYSAMDTFVFASQSETQGLVLAEAMAAGVPIVGVDAPGVRDVIEDKKNGCLVPVQNKDDFIAAMQWVHDRDAEQKLKLSQACRKTAAGYAMDRCAEKMLKQYANLTLVQGFVRRPTEESPWARAGRMIHTQWDLVKNFTKATGAMMSSAETFAEAHT